MHIQLSDNYEVNIYPCPVIQGSNLLLKYKTITYNKLLTGALFTRYPKVIHTPVCFCGQMQNPAFQCSGPTIVQYGKIGVRVT